MKRCPTCNGVIPRPVQPIPPTYIIISPEWCCVTCKSIRVSIRLDPRHALAA